MYVTNGQIYVFLGAVSYGVLLGVLYGLFSAIKYFIKNKIFGVFLDVAFFVLFAAGYVFFSVKYNFPSLRPYMPLAALLGLWLYTKSFGIIVANISKKLYNIIVHFVKTKLKICRKPKL